MTPAAFSEAVVAYMEFIAQRNGIRLAHDEVSDVRHAVYRAVLSSEARNGRVTVDGLGCVEWVKKYRNTYSTTLVEAKAEWDKRVSSLAQ